MKIYFNELEQLGIYEKAFQNWCKEYDNLVYQKFEEHCKSFEIYFDENGNISWDEGEFISEDVSEDDTKYKLNELNSVATESALKDWIYSYEELLYKAFDSYAKSFKLFFDKDGNVLGEDE
jgi:hypothetical protein